MLIDEASNPWGHGVRTILASNTWGRTLDPNNWDSKSIQTSGLKFCWNVFLTTFTILPLFSIPTKSHMFCPCVNFIPQPKHNTTGVKSTPPKFNMEPENDGFQEELPFLGTSFQIPMWNFEGVATRGSERSQIPSTQAVQCRQGRRKPHSCGRMNSWHPALDLVGEIPWEIRNFRPKNGIQNTSGI